MSSLCHLQFLLIKQLLIIVTRLVMERLLLETVSLFKCLVLHVYTVVCYSYHAFKRENSKSLHRYFKKCILYIQSFWQYLTYKNSLAFFKYFLCSTGNHHTLLQAFLYSHNIVCLLSIKISIWFNGVVMDRYFIPLFWSIYTSHIQTDAKFLL